MAATTIFFVIWSVLGFILAAFFAFAIMKSIGFKSLFAMFKVAMKKKKGWGLVLMFQKTGNPRYIPIKFEGEMLQPLGEGEGKYIYKSSCVYENEYNLPCIMYRTDDANPIDPKTGIMNNTSPMVLENTLAKALKAEQSYAGDFMSFLKKHWLKILLFYLGPLAILGFIALNQQDTIVNLASQAGQKVVLNASSIGK